MNEERSNGLVGENANLNNNALGKKPHIRPKPIHLSGNKVSGQPYSKDTVTPKGWNPQKKFSFGSADEKQSSSVTRSNVDSRFSSKWRPAPKIQQKQPSRQSSSVDYSSVREVKKEILEEKSQVSNKAGIHNNKIEDTPREFQSLKRMWSTKAKTPNYTRSPQFDYKPPDFTPSDTRNGTDTSTKSRPCEENTSVQKQQVNRSTSSSSDGSIRTASFKSKDSTWHYVTANPVNFPSDALPSKIDFDEPLPAARTQTKKFDRNINILAPKPFQSSFDESGSIQRPRHKESMTARSKKLTSKNSRRSRHTRRRKSSSSESESSARENPEEKEMRDARRKGTYVTRLDSRGNMYKINPRTGDIMHVDDMPGNSLDDKRAVLKRMDAVSIGGATITHTNVDEMDENSSKSDEEIPPPLLPRERISHYKNGSVVPPRNKRMQENTHTVSMYSSDDASYPSVATSYLTEDLVPESEVPPPLLPRGEPPGATNLQDYTPMSGNNSADIPTNDIVSVGSSVSLNSYLDQVSYERMGSKDSRTMSPADEDETLPLYSSAVDPPKLVYKRSVREYHEIDPEVPGQSVIDVPPPPEHDPPSLPTSPRANSQSSQSAHEPPESPPPLPPMNPSQKKLNYVDVEFRSGGSHKAAENRKSSKTNYSEVVIGGLPKEESEVKKGKTVKEKLMAMITSKKVPDGYSSEGDAIIQSKHDDERTTDFAKERNKLKRLSGRILRKKKQKAKQSSRESHEYVVSPSQNQKSHVPVAVYGSATNLTAVSSDSSRSLSHATSNNSGSSGDGQVKGHNSQAAQRKSITDRRQSHEPTPSQHHHKLGEKSLSEAQLHSAMSVSKTNQDYSFALPGSTEGTPVSKHQTHINKQDTSGSPLISASPIKSHLHQSRPKTLVPSSRPTSDPPVMDYLDMGGSPQRTVSYNPEMARTVPRPPKTHDMVYPLPAIKRMISDDQPEKLSPNFPDNPPPLPPPVSNIPEIQPPSEESSDPPPAPMRDLKPDRFKSHRPRSFDPEYTAAENIHQSGENTVRDPIYDDVHPDDEVTPTPKLSPLSASTKSKLLESEPLYQVYRDRTLSHASMRVRGRSLKRGVSPSNGFIDAGKGAEDAWESGLMNDDAGSTTLWREVKEVVASKKGEDLTNDAMRLQQAQFEVVTSQASYMRSLNILIDHFMNDPAMMDHSILPKKQKKDLFSNIVDVRKVEQRFLQEIEQHFWSKLYLTDIAQITARFAKSDFEVYVRYVQNQVYQDRILTGLQRSNDRFAVELNRLESSPTCNKLPLLSFLLLPMQRVTRLPLLISAIVNQADSAGDKKAYDSAKQALAVVNKLVKKCNEGARKMQQTEQLAEIAKELKFASHVKTYAIISQSRSLVKKGEMSATYSLEKGRTKVMKLWLFLFTDVLLLAKKKMFLDSGSKYEVIDYAKRAMLFVNERAVSDSEIFLVLLENCNLKRVELTLTPTSLNELSRWTDALNPKHANESEDSIYESWDCPQYQCVEPYTALQPDELSLDEGDVMRVLKKTGDGWLEGERLRDNETGWFPAANCLEIEDEHVRARNLKNLYRIIPHDETHST